MKACKQHETKAKKQNSVFVTKLMSASVEMKYLAQDSALILLVSALIRAATSKNEQTSKKHSPAFSLMILYFRAVNLELGIHPS